MHYSFRSVLGKRFGLVKRGLLATSIVFTVGECHLVSGAQQPLDIQSIGVTSSYQPNSSHVLIGRSEKRRIWATGLDYEHRLGSGKLGQINYQAILSPFFQERDPTLVGAYYITPSGNNVSIPLQPSRVILVNHAPIGVTSSGSGVTYLYPLYGSERTYAVEIQPLGATYQIMDNHLLHPVFSANFGLGISSRDFPVDNSSTVNFTSSLGAGVQFALRDRIACRLEYLYRHISNADLGNLNPGIDGGVVRLTLTHRLNSSSSSR